MNSERHNKDQVVALATAALEQGQQFMAYNNSLYLIDKTDVYFFDTRDEATLFVSDNISDHDHFSVIHFNSVVDLLRQIPWIENIRQQMDDHPDANGVFNHYGNGFTDALIDQFEKQQLSLFNNQLNTNIMNNENFQYLSDNIKYMGFGESLKEELEKNLREGKPEIQLELVTQIGNKAFEATLNLRKSDSADMYFFNSYHATLEKNNGDKAEQTFYLNKGKGVTAKEAFNLLDGRAVHKELLNKEGESYKAWLKLDFSAKDKNNNFEVKQYHENYGYDLRAAVAKYAVAEMKVPEKEEALIQSLKKGNVQSVTIEKDGNSHKLFIEADPQFKKVTLYDANMKMVAKESLDQFKSGVEQVAKQMEKNNEPDEKKELKAETKPEKETKNEQTLLPKKRESKGKKIRMS
jgi:hypothetical protein